MKELPQALEEYLTIRRALGYKLHHQASLLRSFIKFVLDSGGDHITTALALQWAQLPFAAQPATKAQRLGLIRRLAVWLSTSDPRTEIPHGQLLPYRYSRKAPYIYSDEEIGGLLQAAKTLPSSTGLRALTFTTLFGLLAVTGMRISEAVHLDRDDVDLDRGLLTIQHTKFGKSRLVPLHASAVEALTAYARRRDELVRTAITPAFFLSEEQRRVTVGTAEYTFARLSVQIGLREPALGTRHGRGPRIHDLRHHFAVATLIDFYRAGLDVEREIPKLSTYLGHAHVHDTYWYLEAVPELLALATERLMAADGKEK